MEKQMEVPENKIQHLIENLRRRGGGRAVLEDGRVLIVEIVEGEIRYEIRGTDQKRDKGK